MLCVAAMVGNLGVAEGPRDRISDRPQYRNHKGRIQQRDFELGELGRLKLPKLKPSSNEERQANKHRDIMISTGIRGRTRLLQILIFCLALSS
jgi:hypothetical protein